ncbi:MAG: winged helix family transcriptional regulator [Spirochaetaceae bacterium]|nr:MAG: winged helix family transcriptional regulator [Spirochaetaceae bacterium]
MTPDRLTVHCIAVSTPLADQIRLYVDNTPQSGQWSLSWSRGLGDLPRCDALVLPGHMLPDLRTIQPGMLLSAQVIAFGPAELIPVVLLRGVADFMRTPWSAAELFARLRRRLLEAARADSRFGLTLGAGCVSNVAASASLSAAEYRILQLLLRYAGEVVSRESLYYAIWGRGGANSRTVDVHISSLRCKLRTLASDAGSCAIQSVRGEGYLLSGHDSLVDNL